MIDLNGCWTLNNEKALEKIKETHILTHRGREARYLGKYICISKTQYWFSNDLVNVKYQIKLNSNSEFEYVEESNYIKRDINSKIVTSSDNTFEEKYNELLVKYDKLCAKYNDLADKYISVKYPEIEELKIKE